MMKEKNVNHVAFPSLFLRKNYIIHFFLFQHMPVIPSFATQHVGDKPKVHANMTRIDDLVRIKENVFLKLVIFSFFW